MKILFIGCVESSYRLLSELIYLNKSVVGVITKKKSDLNSDFIDISIICKNNGIPYQYAQNINDVESLEFIKNLAPDIGYCFGWSQLLKEQIINLFPMGVVGFHPAALPNNRGRHPIIWALALGLRETASTFFMINSGADEGDIVSQRKVVIDYNDDARILYGKILMAAVEQEIEFTDSFEKGTVEMIPQNLTEGNSWRKRGKEDGRIDWRMSSRSIYNLVRSLTRPYAGAHFVYNKEDYKVWKVQELEVSGLDNIEPGKVLAANDNGTIDVKVSDGAIRLIDFDKVQIKEGDYIL